MTAFLIVLGIVFATVMHIMGFVIHSDECELIDIIKSDFTEEYEQLGCPKHPSLTGGFPIFSEMDPQEIANFCRGSPKFSTAFRKYKKHLYLRRGGMFAFYAVLFLKINGVW